MQIKINLLFSLISHFRHDLCEEPTEIKHNISLFFSWLWLGSNSNITKDQNKKTLQTNQLINQRKKPHITSTYIFICIHIYMYVWLCIHNHVYETRFKINISSGYWNL